MTLPSDRPLLVFDGDCRFCRVWVERWRSRVGDRVDFAASQVVASRFSQVPQELFDSSSVLIEPDGTVEHGALAVLRALARAPGRHPVLAAYRRVPGFASIVEGIYRAIARNRRLASRFTRGLVGRDVEPETFVFSRRLFLRLLAITYFSAFASFAVQIDGLIGSDGILPGATLLERAHAAIGSAAYWQVPTVFWLGASDFNLRGACVLGCLASVVALVGILPRPAFALLWILYLSLVSIGNVFLGYQWDSLLLETGALAVFLAPDGLRERGQALTRMSRATLWLLRWLLLRLMLFSGLAKLLSGDPTWRELRALDYHFFSQPLPNAISYYAHHLPGSVHAVMTGATLLIEIGLPLLVLLPRQPRRLACAGFVLLQIMIGLTGNYGFFNLSTVALCVLLLDDRLFSLWLPARLGPGRGPSAPRARPELRGRIPATLLVVLILATSGLQICARLRPERTPSEPERILLETLARYRLVNGYGLFAVMTTERPEILLEGSRDGTRWMSYDFQWKPGPPDRAPGTTGLHMPRLDWQMWFAALRGCRRVAWFHHFLLRILEGSDSVRGLLRHDPFPDEPPRFLRSTLYHYEFGDYDSRDPNWWKRTEVGPFCPVVTLVDGKLTAVDER